MKLEWINERWFGFTEDSNMTKAGFTKYNMSTWLPNPITFGDGKPLPAQVMIA